MDTHSPQVTAENASAGQARPDSRKLHAVAPSERVVSVDALRGFDMFWIAGGAPFVMEFFKLFANPLPPWLGGQFEHTPWVGFNCWDLIMPFIIDNTELDELERLHPLLLNMRVDTVTSNSAGAESLVRTVMRASGLSKESPSKGRAPAFRRDPEIEDLIRDVSLGSWDSAIDPAFEVLAASDDDGNNTIFTRLVPYQECPDADMAWGARMTMETLVDLAPHLFTRSLIASLATSSNFSLRGSAASICLVLAQFAPDSVPVDVVMKLARYDEDWYVMEPATATLKSLCKARRNILSFFYKGLQESEPQARAHAARALRGIAAREPEILEAERLQRALRYLRRLGDKEAEAYISEAYERARVTVFEDGYKYGLGQ